MSIKKQASGSYRVMVFGGRNPVTGKRISRTGTEKTYADAKRLETQLRAEIDAGGSVGDARVTLADYLDQWQHTRRIKVAATTHHRQGQLIAIVKREMPAVRLDKLTAMHLETMYADLLEHGRSDGQGGLAPRTVHHIHRMMTKALRDAVKRGVVPVNVATVADAPKVIDKQIDLPTDDEIARVVDQLRGTRYWPLVVTMMTTGIRRGEAAALQWGDIDGNKLQIRRAAVRVGGQTVIKETKTTSSTRTVALPPVALEVLEAWRVEQRRDHMARGIRPSKPWIVPALSGECVSPSTITGTVRAAAKRAGVRFSPHMFRHAHATALLVDGVDLRATSARLGHSRTSTTLNVYAHVRQEAEDAAVSAGEAAARRLLGG